MALTSPPTAVAPFDKGRLAAGITASATSLTVSPIYKTVGGVRTKQGINTTSGCAIISAGDFTELVTYTSINVDATTKITTVSGLTRGRDPTQTTAAGSFAGGTGRVWAKGAKFTVVADATYFQSGVFTNVANTFIEDQTLAQDVELQFDDSGTAIWDDGTDLNFKSSTTAAKTLAQLAAAGGSDEKAAVSINDTTPDYLVNKITGGDGITVTETDDAGDETLDIDVQLAADPGLEIDSGGLRAKIDATGLTRTSSGLGLPTPGADGQVLTSSGTAWASEALPTQTRTIECIYSSGVASTTLTNPTSATSFNTHTLTIPANALTATTGYEIDIIVRLAKGVNSTWSFGMNTVDVELDFPSTGTSGTVHIKGLIMGTAAAGAAVPVRRMLSGISNDGILLPCANVVETNKATNGELAITFYCFFGSSNGGNAATIVGMRVNKFSSTPF